MPNDTPLPVLHAIAPKLWKTDFDPVHFVYRFHTARAYGFLFLRT